MYLPPNQELSVLFLSVCLWFPGLQSYSWETESRLHLIQLFCTPDTKEITKVIIILRNSFSVLLILGFNVTGSLFRCSYAQPKQAHKFKLSCSVGLKLLCTLGNSHVLSWIWAHHCYIGVPPSPLPFQPNLPHEDSELPLCLHPETNNKIVSKIFIACMYFVWASIEYSIECL